MNTRAKKKSKVVEAFQLTADTRTDNSEWPAWLNEAWNRESRTQGAVGPSEHGQSDDNHPLAVYHNGIEKRVNFGDWILRSEAGVIYPCSDADFVANYNVLEEVVPKLGLYQRYHIEKTDGTRIDPKAEYFILRLDKGGRDPVHLRACRFAAMVYAAAVANHLPDLADDIFERYNGVEFYPEGLRNGTFNLSLQKDAEGAAEIPDSPGPFGLLHLGRGSFGDAMRALKEGQKIARTDWDVDVYVALIQGYLGLQLFSVKGQQTIWTPSGGDCLADDWGIVKKG